MTESTTIRDFVYLDVDRLYSLYSQVFEGVAGEIIQSVVNSASSGDTQKGNVLSGLSVETQVAEVSRRTESKFLHHEMYNRLEGRLADAILRPTGLTAENYHAALRDAFIVKIRGPVEIEDYARLHDFMSKFNALGASITYAQLQSEELRALKTEVEAQIAASPDRNQKAAMRERLKQLTDAKKLAQSSGLHHDEQNLKNLQLWIEMFQREGFEITILSEDSPDPFAFRGVIDKKWLRLSPEMLRALYGGAVPAAWTMVGQVTYMPGDGARLDAQTAPVEPVQPASPDNPSMRDPFRNMFRSGRLLERAFFESNERTEVIMCPLAIYREATLPNEAGKSS